MTARTAMTSANPVVSDAAGGAVRPRHVRFAAPQHDVADHHQHVAQRGSEDRHVQQQGALPGQ